MAYSLDAARCTCRCLSQNMGSCWQVHLEHRMTEVLPHSHSAFQFSHILALHTKLHLVSHCFPLLHWNLPPAATHNLCGQYLYLPCLSTSYVHTYCLVLDIERVESCTLPHYIVYYLSNHLASLIPSNMHPVLPQFSYHHCYLEIYCYPSWTKSNCTCFNASLYFCKGLGSSSLPWNARSNDSVCLLSLCYVVPSFTTRIDEAGLENFFC